MPSIVLATLNARYQHCAFGLRYLLANLGELQGDAVIREFTIQQAPVEIVEAVLRESPRIVGLGVYIWNATQTAEVVSLLKRLRPEIVVVLGGPEVSYEVEQQSICRLADYVIAGEADTAFADACREVLSTPRPASSPGEGPGVRVPLSSLEVRDENERHLHPLPPRTAGEGTRVINATVPDLASLALPYDLYTDDDLAHRVIYVEASRGCPYECEFCLSALDIPVRQFPLEPFLAAMQRLLDRGAKIFKFVDRTFNLNLRVSRAILEFFLERYTPGLFLHFEMIPDRLPDALREAIAQFPAGALQFEVGIQTFNEDVAARISRRQNNELVESNLRWLSEHTGVYVHADLIFGLPGEASDSFAKGFDRLVALAPHEIQVGHLKRLRGTPIVRHDAEWRMVYSPHPPYELLQNSVLDFATVQELRRFAKAWDLIANSGNFVETTPLFWASRERERPVSSPFHEFHQFSAWLFRKTGCTHGIALPRLVGLVFRYLTNERQLSPEVVAPILYGDYRRGGRSDVPACLAPHVPREARDNAREPAHPTIVKRQARHASAPG
jgi:radical SAM superfamily enzyme YgiQ (UPF0313 family)